MLLNFRSLRYNNITAIFSSFCSLNPSISCRFKAYPLAYPASPSKPISRFSASLPVSPALKPTVEYEVKNAGDDDFDDVSDELRQKIEENGIYYSSSSPGEFQLLICPKCKGKKPTKRSLSFHITHNKRLSLWRCFADECGWTGQAIDSGETKSTREMTEKGLNLAPLGDELIAYFAGRMISKETLEKNYVMQVSGEKSIAFTYRRNGILVGCKYRSLEKRFWKEKGSELLLYGLDDIREANEIIIVEGEVDKLSMDEAGISSCVAVPGGAPQKISNKLPPMEKDTGFQYIWKCKEYFDNASRIILATDADIPGQNLAEELARRLGRERCRKVCWPKKDELRTYKDANEVLVHVGPNALREIVYGTEEHQM